MNPYRKHFSHSWSIRNPIKVQLSTCGVLELKSLDFFAAQWNFHGNSKKSKRAILLLFCCFPNSSFTKLLGLNFSNKVSRGNILISQKLRNSFAVCSIHHLYTLLTENVAVPLRLSYSNKTLWKGPREKISATELGFIDSFCRKIRAHERKSRYYEMSPTHPDKLIFSVQHRTFLRAFGNNKWLVRISGWKHYYKIASN